MVAELCLGAWSSSGGRCALLAVVGSVCGSGDKGWAGGGTGTVVCWIGSDLASSRLESGG